jgi:hypothetical protein
VPRFSSTPEERGEPSSVGWKVTAPLRSHSACWQPCFRSEPRSAPWAREVERHVGPTEGLPHGLQGAGAYIGWLERSAIFVAVVLGHPGAVAAIFTAKSVARFPSFTREAFAEYYLIGTLLSLFGATAAAVGIRLALGLSAI